MEMLVFLPKCQYTWHSNIVIIGMRGPLNIGDPDYMAPLATPIPPHLAGSAYMGVLLCVRVYVIVCVGMYVSVYVSVGVNI